MKNNLIYFIWWNPGNGMLKMNLELLERYIDTFDGQRIIKIADAKKWDVPDFLKPYEAVTNDPVMGEAEHFKDSLFWLQPDGNTFYAHAKGVSREVSHPLKWWVELLYKGNLEQPPNLTDHLTSGCFGKLRPGGSVPVPWHYSGSFFWFTPEVVERYRQTPIPDKINNRYFTEGFPGMLVKQNEAEFRVHASADRGYDCISPLFWHKHNHLLNEIHDRRG